MSVVSGVIDRLRRALLNAKWRRSKAIRLIIGIALTLVVASLFPIGESQQSVTGYSVGSLWTSADVVAPFSFPLRKDDSRYNRDVRKALENFYPVISIDTSSRRRSLDSLTTIFTITSVADSLSSSTKDYLKEAGVSEEETGKVKEYLVSLSTNAQTAKVTAPSSSEIIERLKPAIEKMYDTMYYAGDLPDDITKTPDKKLSLRKRTNSEQIILSEKILTKESLLGRITMLVEQKGRVPSNVRSGIAKLIVHGLVPNVNYDPDRSEESRQALIKRVPRTDGFITEGQIIIGKGDVITPGAKAALESLAESRINLGGAGARIGRILGTVGHVAIIILLFVLYVKFIRRRIYKDNAQLVLISGILIFPAVLAFLSVQIHTSLPLEYLILIPVTSMLLTVLFDSRTGFYGTVIVALIVAGIRGNDYNVALAGLSAGAFAAYTVRDLRSRGQLFTSIGYIFLGYFIAICALSFERGAPLSEIGLELAFAAGNAILSPILVFASVYVVESLFDTLSDLKLTDFDDINHPLLRKLSDEAPGTYHHTMLVAQLAENAALAIGANSLLAKIGAYFHDIGKLARPTDFIENQSAGEENVHNAITPTESARRVRSHVTGGIALAQEYKLPIKISDFIPMHHGTLRISFFYQKALGAMAAGAILDESLFRYPGPKPNTKETAIVMLADASEAVARMMSQRADEATVDTIEAELDILFRERIADGQLDDCDLTLRDLVIVRSVFARLLIGTFHARIAYPPRMPAPQPA